MATYLRVIYGETNLNRNDGWNAGVVFTDMNGNGINNGDNESLIGIFGGWAGKNMRIGLENNS